jgi:hypothetical protein
MAAGGSIADPNVPITVPMNAAGVPICDSGCRGYFEEFYVRTHSCHEAIFVELLSMKLARCARSSG